MNEKLFSKNVNSYVLSSCGEQNNLHNCYSYSLLSLNGGTGANINYIDSDNPQQQQSVGESCNIPVTLSSRTSMAVPVPVATYQEQTKLLSQETTITADLEKDVKMFSNLEMIQITNKNSSSASYYSNDLLVPDYYKSTIKNVNYHDKVNNSQNLVNQNSNYSHTHKIYEYSSCAQENAYIKDCTLQKNPNLDITTRNCGFNQFAIHEYTNMYENIAPTYNISYYDSNFMGIHNDNSNYYNPTTSVRFEHSINQMDDSNEGSDIIVEESEEEVTDYSEDPENQCFHQMNKCLMCNIIFTPLGAQFYFLTLQNPLTMSSQKPVFNLIVDIIGNISTRENYLCSECLSLINTVDNLQLKLTNIRCELINKFKKSCRENNMEYSKNNRHPTRKKKYIKHIKKDQKYKCKWCKQILSFKKYCHYHLKKHKNLGYLCEICGKIIAKRKQFLRHCHQHKVKRKKKDFYKCPSCEQIFRILSRLREHENYCLGIFPFKCKQCDKKFATATKLKNHVKLKHEKKFVAICSICNIGFIKVSDHKSHMIIHSTEKKFSCTKCNKSYKSLGNLNFHMKIHSGKLPLSCHICGKGFLRKEYLEAHTNNHNGIKRFLCTVCDKKFVAQKNLDAHLKYHEGSVKKNTCNTCGKIMTSGFEEHLRIHNNLREFQCSICNMKFNAKGTLSKHVARKHCNSNTLTQLTTV